MNFCMLSLRILKRTSNPLRSLRLSSNTSAVDTVIPFDELVTKRRNEAQRSMLVEVASVDSASCLYDVCSEFGSVKHMFYYNNNVGNSKKMILVEFADSTSLQTALKNTQCFPKDSSFIPVHSPLVRFSADKNPKTPCDMKNTSYIEILVSDTNQMNDAKLLQDLYHCKDVSRQIEMLCDYEKLTELGWRLRFFTCRQVEIALSGLYPKVAVLPFGSSLNTFGRWDCDLDMILDVSNAGILKKNQKLMLSTDNPQPSNKRQMEVIAGVIDNFIPGCCQVRKILGARVPIIKYYQSYANIECDLSMFNKSGFYMTEMLYMYGCMDPRVRPLIFTIRYWAKNCNVTSPVPGRWISNFSLTLLVLFYLMTTPIPVIPPLQKLIQLAGANDYRVTFGIDCTFLRDLRTLAPSSNEDSLETLLKGFFEFYDKFNFKERAISIVKGKDFVKPTNRALYIQNPLERTLNVSRNVTFEEIEHLKLKIGLAHSLLKKRADSVVESSNKPWGILQLFNSSVFSSEKKRDFYAIDLENIFSEDPVIKVNRKWKRKSKKNNL